MCTGILMGCMHLLVEVVLHKVPEIQLTVSFWLLCCSFLRPLRELGSAILITVDTELGIGYQPFLVVVKELFIILSSLDTLPLLLKQDVQIVQLSLEHALVIYLWQGIQLLAQLFIFNL